MQIETTKEQTKIEMWPEEKIQRFRKQLLDWYDVEKRDLPWRRNTDPYSVWVSEIMLQQTRVDTVVPYFERFMQAFPQIKDLAEAPPEQLMKLWEGLGYYSRARNMQAAAQQVMDQFNGVFPDTIKDILSLKGIGPYTGGAVASIAFGLPEPAIDGNVMRVMSRLFEIDADIAKPASRKIFDRIMRELIDPERPGDFNQALMDLGATVSTPTDYRAELNPVKEFDQSYLNGTWKRYPIKSKKKKPVPFFYDGLAIQNTSGAWLLEQRPETGLLAGMWLFPLVENQQDDEKKWKEFPEGRTSFLEQKLKDQYGITTQIAAEPAGEVTHIFSHLKWTITVFKGSCLDQLENTLLPSHCRWVTEDEMDRYVMPVPQQKMKRKVEGKMTGKK